MNLTGYLGHPTDKPDFISNKKLVGLNTLNSLVGFFMKTTQKPKLYVILSNLWMFKVDDHKPLTCCCLY